MLYPSLIEIGLEKYLNKYFFNKEWLFEQYLVNLNYFVASKDNSQKNILKSKFLPNLDHVSTNDHFNELLVACAFHPHGLFQEEILGAKSADLIDNGTQIEVKTINASPEEIERIKILKPNSIRCDIFPKDNEYEMRICQKFDQRVIKAKKQTKGKGLIYLVWDSTFVINWESRRDNIKVLFEKLILKEKTISPNLNIRAIFFGDLREMVTNQSDLNLPFYKKSRNPYADCI